VKKYYALEVKNKEADIYIFGDIVDPTVKDFWGIDADVSGYSLAQEVKDLDVDVINVHINSYGGVVSEGLAIYNTLKNHKAKIRTIVDGFACSAASVIFMAGDERLMNDASLLMIHQAWTYASGNADDLRKTADDLDKITQGSIEAYKTHVNISEEKLKELMKAETWILPSEAVEWGFATGIFSTPKTDKAAASAQKALFSMVANRMNAQSIQIDAEKVAALILEHIKAELAVPSAPLLVAEPPIEEPAEPTAERSEEPQESKTLNLLFAL